MSSWKARGLFIICGIDPERQWIHRVVCGCSTKRFNGNAFSLSPRCNLGAHPDLCTGVVVCALIRKAMLCLSMFAALGGASNLRGNGAALYFASCALF